MDERQAAKTLSQLRASGRITHTELKTAVSRLRSRGEPVLSSRLVEELRATGQLRLEDTEDAKEFKTVRIGETPVPVSPLAVLGERFRDVKPLGAGGMGKVFAAFDTLLERPVAIKLLRAQGGGLAGVLAEARAQARVEHEGVCPIYDVVEEGGQGFVVMRLIPGKSLDAYVGKLAPQEVAAIGAQVARALHAAHQHGLVHRDVKPANILIEQTEKGIRASVVDFGLCSEAGKEVLAGTPGYLAPEVATLGPKDGRVDIFGLGASLYHLVAGEPPQCANSLLELVQSFQKNTWSPPLMPNPPFPPDLAWILKRALAPAPEDRYPTAEAFAEDLERFLRGEPVVAHPRTVSYLVWGAWVRHRRWLGLAFVGGLALTVLGVATRVILRQREQAELASKLQVELLSLEERFRSALTRPKHDITGERRQLRRELERAGQQAAKAGLAQESLLLLLGRAHLALGFPERAVAFLEQAAQKPRAPPMVNLLLGTGLLYLLQEEQARVAQLPPGEARRAQEKTLEKRQERARSLLSSAPAALTDKLAQARLAYLQRRWQEAVDLALASRGETPWVYEPELLAGEALLAWARELFDRGGYGEAEGLLQRAQEHFSRASEQAPSHPQALLGLAQALFEQANCAGETGGQPEQFWRRAMEVAQEVAQVDGENSAALHLVAMAHLRLADFALRWGLWAKAREELTFALHKAEELEKREPKRSWGPTLAGVASRLSAELAATLEERQKLLEQAKTNLEEALAREPSDSLAANNLGLLFLGQGLSLWTRGAWPEEFLARAEALFRDLAETFPSTTLLVNLSATTLVEAHAALFANRDPQPLLTSGEKALAKALELNPVDTAALNNQALAYLELAQYAIHQGQPAEHLLQQGHELFEKVLQINPNDPVLPDNRLRWVTLRFQALAPGKGVGEALWKEAQKWRQRVVGWEESPEAQGQWAGAMWEMGRWLGGSKGARLQREAWAALKEAQTRWPHHPDLALFHLAWRRAEGRGLRPSEQSLVAHFTGSSFALLAMGFESLTKTGESPVKPSRDKGALWRIAQEFFTGRKR
ncbi:MAG: protein kinase domain-containing protein [Thermoanaerobaculaceae bacterium]